MWKRQAESFGSMLKTWELCEAGGEFRNIVYKSVQNQALLVLLFTEQQQQQSVIGPDKSFM